MTIAAALARAAGELSRAGIETPRLDAELLLAQALNADRARLVMEARSPLPAAAAERLAALLARREAREPVAYILGRRAFRNLELAVDCRVLIPRPETELLVEVGLSAPAGVRVVDVGTGSGAVALALKDERPDLKVTGLDLSADALAVAAGNARRLGLDVAFVQADLLDDGEYAVVLANLPYVREDERPALAPEIIRFEPPGALFAGADGLDVVRRLVPLARGATLLALEHGAGQAEAVSELVAGAGFPSVNRLRDLAGHERVVVGRR